MKVALLKGQSQYGVLRLMIDEVACAFQRRGWDVVIADLEAMQGLTIDELGRRLTAGGPLDLVFSINIGGNFVDEDGQPMIELTGAPHVVQYVDYPLHDLNRLTSITPSTALLLVDPSHVQTIDELMGPERFAYTGFSPHGALGSPRQIPGRAETYADQRPINILFAGSYYRTSEQVWDAYPPLLRKVFLAAVETATATDWISPLDALDLALSSHGLDPNGRGVPGLQREDVLRVRMLAAQVQDWVRTTRRDAFLKAAVRTGLPLTVVGKDYEGVLDGCRTIEYRGSLGVADTIRLMQNARLLVNLNGNFGRGSHERPLTAMVAGAAVASDYSSFYAEQFEEGREIVLFRWNALDDGLARIADLSRDPQRLFEMARAGQAKAMAQHRWDNRIDAIVAAGKAAAEAWGLTAKTRAPRAGHPEGPHAAA